MTKGKNIRRFTAAELEERRARGEDRTDWARVRAKSEEELERDIASDPDWKDVPTGLVQGRRGGHAQPTKKLLSLRLDADVVDWFKQRGPGYQTRMNAVLRAFMQQKKRA